MHDSRTLIAKEDYTKIATKKIDIEYDDTIASNYNSYQKAACLGYVNPQGIARCQLFREQHERLGVVKVKLGLTERIPTEYHQFLDIFRTQMAYTLSSHHTFDLAICLTGRTDPLWGPIYILSAVELKAQHVHLDKMLRTGKIRLSKSLAGAPILFIPKAHRNSLCLCLDYRGLIKITVLNRYPLSLMNKLRDRGQGAKLFTTD
jgi:hypothetical protein